MGIPASVVLVVIALILIVGGMCGSVIGKKREGDRWAKSANKKLIEFEQNLYEVTKVNLDKPIAYDK
jgi:hypothetical protein